MLSTVAAPGGPSQVWELGRTAAAPYAAGLRSLRIENRAILHHACYGLVDGSFTANSWWACEDPARPLDDDTLFDAYCAKCRHRLPSGS